MITIFNLTIFPISIPLKTTMYMNSRSISKTENVIVKVTLSNGIVGWGEAPAAARMTGETSNTISSVIEKILKPLILDKDIDNYKQIIGAIHKSIKFNSGSKNAVILALLDSYCKFINCPLYTLLGSVKRIKFQPIRILGNQTWDENTNEANELKLQGYNNFKIKVLSHSLDSDIQGSIYLRKTLGYDTTISSDANCGLSIEESNKYIIESKLANLQFFEQPTEEVPELSLIQNKSIVDICADECIFNKNDLHNLIQQQAVRGVNLKLCKTGDPFKLVEMAYLASDSGLKVNLSGKVAETGILSSALLHCAAVVPNIDWGVSTTTCYLIADVTNFKESSLLELSTGPGLGVEVYEDIIVKYLTQD